MPIGGLAVGAADFLAAMIEKVDSRLPEMFERTSRIAQLIKPSSDVEQINDKLYRIPFMKYAGGVLQKYNPDLGALGDGSGMALDKLTAGYIYTNYSVLMSMKAIHQTDTTGKSVVNAFSKQMAETMTEMSVLEDIQLHGWGDGVLTEGASATGTWAGGTKATYTFAGASDTLRTNRLRPGMAVHPYASNLTTQRANGTNAGKPHVIEEIDYDNHVVYLNGLATSAASGDILAFVDQDAPGTLRATGTSTWPLTGDTWRHGIYYANETNTSLYYLGLLRSTYRLLNAAAYAAGTQPFVHNHTLLVLDKLRRRRGEEVTKGLMGIVDFSQRAQIYSIGITISEWDRGNSSGKMPDLMPEDTGYEDSFPIAGVPHILSKRQYRSRVDYINPSLWGRAVAKDKHFFGDNMGRKFFEPRDPNGNVLSGLQFWVCEGFDWVCFDPGAQAVITGLSTVSGYD